MTGNVNNRIARRYILLGTALVLALYIVMEIVQKLTHIEMEAPIMVSMLFSLSVTWIVGWLWKWIASNHSDQLTTFYSATSGFRLLLALAVLFVCFLVVGRDAMLIYVLVFMLFYLLMVGFHSIYFSRVTNKT